MNEQKEKAEQELSKQQETTESVMIVNVSENGGAKRSIADEVTDSFKQIDKNILLRLLKNPLEGLKLNHGKDLVYGILGIAAAIVCFLIWVLFIGGKLNNMLFGILPLGGLDSFLSPRRSIGGAVFGKMFLVAIISSVSLLASLWLNGLWMSKQRISITAFITKIGAIQFMAGAGFLAASILALIGIKLSMFIVGFTLLSVLVLSVIGASEVNRVTKQSVGLYVIVSIASYLLLLTLLSGIIL